MAMAESRSCNPPVTLGAILGRRRTNPTRHHQSSDPFSLTTTPMASAEP